MSTFGDRITSVRRLINDSEAPQRYSDSDILAHLNEAMKIIAKVRGEFFQRIDLYDCVDEDPFQQLDPLQSFGLIDVLGTEQGTAVTRVDRGLLQNLVPGWILSTPAAPVHWWPGSASDPLSFHLYPRPSVGTRVYIMHVGIPPTYISSDTFPIPDYFGAALDDYVAARIAMIDDGEFQMDRAEKMLGLFTARIGGGSSGNVVSETPA